jgi:UDP-3-O-[3-hydroxymyristoyl] glucosamine N-acyltransferase
MHSNHFFRKAKKFILLKDVFDICNLNVKKNISKKIFGVNNLDEAKNNEITFFDNLNYEKKAKHCNALACVVNEKNAKYLNKNVIPVISNNPLVVFYKIVNIFYPESSLDNEKVNIFRQNQRKLNKTIFFSKIQKTLNKTNTV